MRICPGCQRHVHREDAVCPFCGSEAAVGSRPGRTLRLVGAGVAAMMLTACYGPPPREQVELRTNEGIDQLLEEGPEAAECESTEQGCAELEPSAG